MGLLQRILGKNKAPKKEEQSLIVSFKYLADDINPLFTLSKELENILSSNNIGELDGNEVDTDLTEGTLFFYGDNAEQIKEAIQSTLLNSPIIEQITIKKRTTAGVEELKL